MAERAFRAGSALFDVHMKFARREAQEDFSRVAGGVALLGVSAIFALFLGAAANVACAIALHDLRNLSWQGSAAVMAGANGGLLVACLVAARTRLRRPVLRETRDLVEKTVGAFIGRA